MEEPFIQDLKCNIASHLTQYFKPKKIPDNESNEFTIYGEQSLETLLQHYGVPKAAVTPNVDPFTKKPLISPDIQTEWKMLYSYDVIEVLYSYDVINILHACALYSYCFDE